MLIRTGSLLERNYRERSQFSVGSYVHGLTGCLRQSRGCGVRLVGVDEYVSARLLGIVGDTRQDRSTGSGIALQLVGDDPEWLLALTAQQSAKEPLGCTLIASK
jgi:hypothetical protein